MTQQTVLLPAKKPCGAPCLGGPRVWTPTPDAPDIPRIGKLAWNYLHSLTRRVLNGTLYVPLEVVVARLDVCEANECEQRNEGRCAHPECGCHLDVRPDGAPGKAQLATEDCPLGKWEQANKAVSAELPKPPLIHLLVVPEETLNLCVGCGECCTAKPGCAVPVREEDIQREPKLTPYRGAYLVGESGAPCPFLAADRRCSIHATKPMECRAFAAGGDKCATVRANAGFSTDGGGGATVAPALNHRVTPVPAPSPSSAENAVNKKVTWACGLTTIPERKDKLLPNTLGSLRRAGFPAPTLFADGCDDPKAFAAELAALSPWFVGLRIVNRWPRIRVFGNFILGLAELYIREPFADRYAMFQDDVQFSANLRPYLDALPFPTDGYWNLYTVPRYQEKCPPDCSGFFKPNVDGKGGRGQGALALVFDRDGVQKLLTTREYIVTRPTAVGVRAWRNIDGGIVDALALNGKHEYAHNPSLVQHAGLKSSIATGAQPHVQAAAVIGTPEAAGHPSPLASSFRGEAFDCLELLDPATNPMVKGQAAVVDLERQAAAAQGRDRAALTLQLKEAQKRAGVR